MADDLEVLGERIAETAIQIDRAVHRLLTDLREFDAKAGWFRQGAASCAAWLSWRVGWELGTAREHVRVARALGQLPLIDDALRLGMVSYCKVRAMTRVATRANEPLLLHDANHTTGEQLEKICRKYALVQRHDEPDARGESRRTVTKRSLEDGMIRIEATLHPDEAALVWAMLDRASRSCADDVSAETHFDRCDALLAIAHEVLRGRAQDRSPIELVVTAPLAALDSERGTAPGAIAMLPTGDCLTTDATRRLACDSGVVCVIEGKRGEPLSVGRRTRSIPASIKRALLQRDRGCRFPGCTNRLYVEGHHIEHWADGGATALSNLVTLCSRHHRFVHEYRYRIELDPAGEPRFVDDRGRHVACVPTRLAVDDSPMTDAVAVIRPPPPTNAPVPYDEIVCYLARADDRTLDVAAALNTAR
jgi:hypothetical protein